MDDETAWEELNKLHQELDYLRYFFNAAQDVFGPANSDVTIAIGEDYEEETGNTIPEDYDFRR